MIVARPVLCLAIAPTDMLGAANVQGGEVGNLGCETQSAEVGVANCLLICARV